MLPFPAYHEVADVEAAEQEALLCLEQELESRGHEYAGLICEPLVQGAGGMRMARPEFFQAVASLCASYDVLLIFDEVMTGFGRLGDWFASTKLGVTPDLICLSKGITGGSMALAATVAQEKIWEAFYSEDRLKAFYHSHSFMANPMACAAAIASFQLLQENSSAFMQMEVRHSQRLSHLAGWSHCTQLRTCGSIAAFNVKTELPSGYFNPVGKDIARRAFERGVFIRPTGDCVYLIPPYCTTDDELDRMYEVLQESVEQAVSAHAVGAGSR